MASSILVPFDGSDPAEEALRYAFSNHPDDSIIVLHVVEPFPEHTEAGSEEYGSKWQQTARELADEIFEAAEAIAQEYDLPIEKTWRYGRPGPTIVQFIANNDIDHVIMGSHGRTGPGRILLGSVAETTVRRSQVPVTIIRSGE